MNENFLHYIWQHQYFDKENLRTTAGFPLQILTAGKHNTNAGADFSDARIDLDDAELCGDVEIHYKSSDWERHGHQHNEAYENVILHVVWEADKKIRHRDGSEIPMLELSKRVKVSLFKRYTHFLNQGEFVPCEQHLENIALSIKNQTLEQNLKLRLERKAQVIQKIYEKTEQNWEETTYRWLGMQFGLTVNIEPFERLCSLISYKTLQRQSTPKQVQALIFGMSGFLKEPQDEYAQELSLEFEFLHRKYELHEPLSASEWKNARLRPGSLPIRRLALWASLLATHKHLHSPFCHLKTKKDLRALFKTPVLSYWQFHDDFGKISHTQTSKRHQYFPSGFADRIIINGVVPIKFATLGQEAYDDICMLLAQMPSESNGITRQWKMQGLPMQNAKDTQASLELYKQYCQAKKCLQCPIGQQILR
ncbi:MAG: DUF2851 family protein [Bernardetiaceae bacterium]|nr:DUF2851 family protein [Bernardetiaceae bacterium]